MNICFLDNTNFEYNSQDIYSYKLRGAETVLINLSKELSNLGHKITVINNCYKNEIIDDISWKKIQSYNEKETFDLAISNGDTRLFDKINSNKKILFSYSLQTFEKFIRKKQIFSYFKHQPKIVFLSDYHINNTLKITSLFGHIRVNWGIDELFINTELNNNIDNNLSTFTSRPDRNLDLLINIWNNHIYPKFNSGKLLITPPTNQIDLSKNIFLRNADSRIEMINDIKKSRIFLIPGHKAELYCLASAEASELCIPIVTLGIGSLSERVIHDKTGFIAKNNEEFSDYTIQLYKNDDLWKQIRNNLIMMRGKNKWSNVASDFMSKV
jgi:glycosyltransferase involved in cell wall biosynthesis